MISHFWQKTGLDPRLDLLFGFLLPRGVILWLLYELLWDVIIFESDLLKMGHRGIAGVPLFLDVKLDTEVEC